MPTFELTHGNGKPLNEDSNNNLHHSVPFVGENETKESFLSAKSVARTLDVPLPTVRFWTRIGMPCHRFGRLTRYRLSAVVAWLEERGDKRLESIRQKLGTKPKEKEEMF